MDRPLIPLFSPLMVPVLSGAIASAANIGAGGGGGAPYVAAAVHLDGSVNLNNPSMSTTGDDTGFVSWVMWFKSTSEFFSPGTVLFVVDVDDFYTSNGFTNGVTPDVEGLINHQFCDVNDTYCWNAAMDGTYLAIDGAWHSLMVSAKTNLSPNASKVYQVYIDDIAFPMTLNSRLDADNAFTLTFNGLSFMVFGDEGAHQTKGDVADYWFAPGQFVDFSIEANRRKFVDTSGKPVYLGANGELPTGTAPAIFFSGDATGFATNKGTGGAFTLTGSLTNASTSPSD